VVAVSVAPDYSADPSVRDLVLRNQDFIRRIGPGLPQPGIRRLRKAWAFLTRMQQAVAATRFAGATRPRHQVAAVLGVSLSAVYWHEEQAAIAFDYFLRHPCGWARLSARARNTLLAHDIRWPHDLTRPLVLELLAGSLGWWGPESSADLNGCLDSLGEVRLHERLTTGDLAHLEAPARRRLGQLYPTVFDNPAFVQMVRNNASRRSSPSPHQLMAAWRALNDRQRRVMSTLYQGHQGPGPMDYSPAARKLSLAMKTLLAYERSAMSILREVAAQPYQPAAA